ncbi:MAG: tRNA pseudouridine(38-40) synthase TruA [Ignavibacteriales bacterium]|nr:tRNA pseudouridine(38-40) synthase TruA [Ignavibacteriales bacterium]
MRTVKLLLEYDGTDFVGWQYQTNGRSVQGILEQALSDLLQESVRVTGAGRTDSGVHARGQVAHFKTNAVMKPRELYRGLNGLLPEDVVVRWVDDVDEAFHARYSAKGRRYCYYVSQAPVALNRKQRWFVGHPLDLAAMQRCADAIVGEHDFQAFCKVESNVDHYRCVIQTSRWVRNGDDVTFEIVGNRFLHGMVRALVGTMVEIGRGYRGVGDFPVIMESRDRTQAGMSAPAQGLVLEEVLY